MGVQRSAWRTTLLCITRTCTCLIVSEHVPHNCGNTLPSRCPMIKGAVLIFRSSYMQHWKGAVFSKIKKTKPIIMINGLLTNAEEPKCKIRKQITPPPDDDIHRFGELLDLIDRPVNTDDYTVSPKQKPKEPTYSVVEVHHPCDPAPSDNNKESACAAGSIPVKIDKPWKSWWIWCNKSEVVYTTTAYNNWVNYITVLSSYNNTIDYCIKVLSVTL